MIIKKPVIIIVGPSGVGKGTIEQILFKDQDLNLGFSISATTRVKRVNEINGVHYFFITKQEFEAKIAENRFFEYNYHLGNYYGTLWSEIDRIHAQGQIPFLEIETEGVKYILKHRENTRAKDFNLITFFILPPSLHDLKTRILNRKSEDSQSLEIRLAKAEQELLEQNNFRYQVINNIPEIAASEIKNKIKLEMESHEIR